MKFSHWTPGQPPTFSASEHNAFCDMAKDWYSSNLPNINVLEKLANSSTIINVYNNSEGDRQFGECLDISDVYVKYETDAAEFLTRTTYTGIRPTKATKTFCILCEPIPNGKVGKAIVSGVAIIQLFIAEGDEGEWEESDGKGVCGVSDGVALKYGVGNTPIIYRQQGTGTVLAAVLLNSGGSGGLVRFKLRGVLYPLSVAKARIILASEDGLCEKDDEEITVYDVNDIMWGQTDPTTGEPRVSAARECCGWAQQNGELYEVVNIGGTCCFQDSSESYSDSSDSSDSSDDSSNSSDSSDGSDDSDGSDNSTSKSTAIVPASWSKGGYTKLFIVEAPDVRFEDLFIVTVNEANTTHTIDPKFYEVIEKDTLEVFGVCPNLPVLVGASIDGDKLNIICPEAKEDNPIRLTMQCTAIRRGFKKLRFPDATRKDFVANEKWLKKGSK